MITTKKELNEWISYEKSRYGLRGGISGYVRYLLGSESATIWHFQKRLRITEYYLNSGKKFQYLFSLIRLNYIRHRIPVF